MNTSRGFTSCLVRFFPPLACNPNEVVLQLACVHWWLCAGTDSCTQAALNLPNRESSVERQTIGCQTEGSTFTNHILSSTLNSKPIRNQNQPVATDSLKCYICVPLSATVITTFCKGLVVRKIQILPTLYWTFDLTLEFFFFLFEPFSHHKGLNS